MERSIIKKRATLSRITFQYIYSFSISVELIDVQMFVLNSLCSVVETFMTDSSYFLHSRIVFDVKQSWDCIPLPYLDCEYSEKTSFPFTFRMICSRKQRFLSLFVCCGVRNCVSKPPAFRLALGTVFLIAFCLLKDWRRGFLEFVVCGEIRNRVSWFPLDVLGGETRFLIIFCLKRGDNKRKLTTFVSIIRVLTSNKTLPMNHSV